jgi:predicted protein tyrosine phosphatase
MEIWIANREIAAGMCPRFDGHSSAAIIRITTWNEWIPLKHPEEFRDEIRLAFSDCTDVEWATMAKKVFLFENDDDDCVGVETPVPPPITNQQARLLVEFIERNKDVDVMVVHCDAGFSRSPAVGMFIAELLGLKDEHNRIAALAGVGHFAPNPTVLERLRNVSGLRSEKQKELNKLFGGTSDENN